LDLVEDEPEVFFLLRKLFDFQNPTVGIFFHYPSIFSNNGIPHYP